MNRKYINRLIIITLLVPMFISSIVEAGSKRRRLAGMIRLGGTLGEDNVGTLHMRLSQQELELAGLVATR